MRKGIVVVHISEIVDEVIKEVAENSTGRSESARGLPRAVPCGPGEEAAGPCGILSPSLFREVVNNR